MAFLGNSYSGISTTGINLGSSGVRFSGESGTSLLLDLYPDASAAYSVRKLRSDYAGSALRVRRSNDNSEQDIGFVGVNLDTESLLYFIEGGNGFVVTWYDQSTNGLNITNATAAQQPQIVSAGSLITISGIPTVRFDGTADRLTRSPMLLSKNIMNVISVQKYVSIADTTAMSLTIAEGTDRQVYFPYRTPTGFQFWYESGNVAQETIAADTNRHLWGLFNDGTNAGFYNNGVQFGTDVANVDLVSTSNFHMGSFSTGAINANVDHQELIIWNTAQTSNRAAIEADINSYYSIY